MAYMIFYSRMASPHLLFAVFSIAAVNNHGFTAGDIHCVSVKGIDRYFIEKDNPGVIDKARALLELILSEMHHCK